MTPCEGVHWKSRSSFHYTVEVGGLDAEPHASLASFAAKLTALPETHSCLAQAPQQPPQTQSAGTAKASPDQAQPVEVVALPTGAEDAAESSTVFVKNLAFATSDAGLQVPFCCCHHVTCKEGPMVCRLSINCCRISGTEGYLLCWDACVYQTHGFTSRLLHLWLGPACLVAHSLK